MGLSKQYQKLIWKMTETRFPGEEDEIVKKACLQYRAFRQTTPDIGGKANMMFKNLDFLIAFFSFYEACDRRIGIPELDEFACEAVIRSSEKAGRLISWNSPLMKKIALKMYGDYKEKVDAHVSKGEWGNTWRIEINPEGHTEGFAIHTRMCPNVDFCRTHGYEVFMSAVCAQDYRIARAMHGILIRTHTVASGDDYCDWWYFGDRQNLPEEALRRLEDQRNESAVQCTGTDCPKGG